jgi:hypothetical protein
MSNARLALARAITVLLASVAVFVTWTSLGIVLFKVDTHGERSTTVEWPGSDSVAHWDSVVARGFVRGAVDAEYQVVVFGDYQCAPCAEIQQQLRLLLDKHPDVVSVRFRNFPVARLHPHAFDAARAAECAGVQGSFGRLQDLLFEKQEKIGLIGWDAFARAAGVPDSAAFSLCMRQAHTARAVDLDVESGRAVGVRGTPTLLINGRVFRSPNDALVLLRRHIETRLAPKPVSGP